MQRDFEIRGGIRLAKGDSEVDLHNHFKFLGFEYAVADQLLRLRWQNGRFAPPELNPFESVLIEFRGVTEFRFLPRNADLPFTEDDCLRSFGYWTDDKEWSEGVFMIDPTQEPWEDWLTALEFMSGGILLVQAESGHAFLERMEGLGGDSVGGR